MRCLSVIALIITFLTGAAAHHATAVEYDTTKTVVFKGKVSRLNWSNPHIHVYIVVKAANGRDEEWDVEFPSPGGAIVAGVQRQAVAPGEVIEAKGYPLKTDSRGLRLGACATEVTLADGTRTTFVVGV